MNELTVLLKTEFESRRKKNSQFSLRAFSRWLGLSPAQVSQIMSGKRTITTKSFAKISDKLSLSPFEQKKYMYATKGKQPSQDQQKKKLAEDQFRLIADWYHMAILSLTRVKEAKSDSRWIAQQLGITVQQANEAMSRLVRLGCLQLKPEFKQIGEPFEVTSDIPSTAIRKYHQQCLQLASEKIEQVSLEKRQIQSLNFPMSLKTLPKFKILIDTFLDDALTLTEKSDKQQEEVFQLNVQLIPVTQIHK
ncbi:TIGR02147 family protein [Pseudobdellovibrio sp. HCB154]|uniref:TIGR02147 family protein n=1 Tax=Pseudobdellovibrio sp. HCB154 TaxID=3386277 RepID=UPI0039170C74